MIFGSYWIFIVLTSRLAFGLNKNLKTIKSDIVNNIKTTKGPNKTDIPTHSKFNLVSNNSTITQYSNSQPDLIKQNKSLLIKLIKKKTTDDVSLRKRMQKPLNKRNMINAISTTTTVPQTKQISNPVSKVPSIFQSLSTNNEPRQYCGETLYYVVEYFCVYIKGTSVYVPDNDLENINVINSNEKKVKRENSDDYDEQQAQGGIKNLVVISFFYLKVLFLIHFKRNKWWYSRRVLL